MRKLPLEIIDGIMLYTTFQQSVAVSDFAAKVLYKFIKIDSRFFNNMDINIVKWLHKYGKEDIIIRCVDHAIWHNQSEILEFISNIDKQHYRGFVMDSLYDRKKYVILSWLNYRSKKSKKIT